MKALVSIDRAQADLRAQQADCGLCAGGTLSCDHHAEKAGDLAVTVKLVKVLLSQYGLDGTESWGPGIVTGDHESLTCNYAISWEEGPDEWVFDDQWKMRADIEVWPDMSHHAEAVYGWGLVAVYAG